MLAPLYLGLEGWHLSKREVCVLYVYYFNDRVLCVYAPSGYNTRQQLDRGRFFDGLHIENKNKGNENKIILEDFNCTMDKMGRDGEKKTQRLYWCCSSYALSKLIVDNGLEDLWRRENPDSPEFTCYDRSFAKGPR